MSLTVTGQDSVSLRPGPAHGIYLVKLESGKATMTRKIIIIK